LRFAQQKLADIPLLQVPTIGLSEVLDKVYMNASAGLPHLGWKKRDFKTEMKLLVSRFLVEQTVTDMFFPFSAAFKRFQVTSDKLKARLVFAVNYKVSVIEGYYDAIFKRVAVNADSPFIIGKTQIELSELMLKQRGHYCLGLDATSFDNTLPSEVMIMAYGYLADVCGLTPFKRDVLYRLMQYTITLPLFHPNVRLQSRQRGQSSGSGLTSTINSISMYLMHCAAFHRYCLNNRINVGRISFSVLVSGDDSVIVTNQKIDFKKYAAVFFDMFGMTLKLESECGPDENNITFLGSTWKHGVPYRDINRMFSRILFGNSNLPRLDSVQMLFCSRAFDILGNSGDFGEIWRDFNIRMPDRVFRFTELAGEARLRNKNFSGRNPLGYWGNTGNLHLNHVWSTR
jgi:hypothetical protein